MITLVFLASQILCSYGPYRRQLWGRFGGGDRPIWAPVLTSAGEEDAQNECVVDEVSDGGFQGAAFKAMRPVQASAWSARQSHLADCLSIST